MTRGERKGQACGAVPIAHRARRLPLVTASFALGLLTTACLALASPACSDPARPPPDPDAATDADAPPPDADAAADAPDAPTDLDGGDGATGCPDDLPAACPTPAPSYQSDIVPLIQRDCAPCHLPGGSEALTHDFSKYTVVYAQRTSILDQIHACLMPPADGGVAPPPEADRVLLLDWLVCHAPNN